MKPSELACLLDKVARGYPLGIPRTALTTPTLTPAYRCAFLVVSDSQSTLETHADLIDAICTKGLKLDRSLCDARVVSDSGHEWQGSGIPMTVVLGSSRVPGSIESSGATTCLFSHSLEAIASNAGSKREFWGHLQTLLRA